jgi:hypothetical protein
MITGIVLGVIGTVLVGAILLVSWAAVRNAQVRENLEVAGKGFLDGTLKLVWPWAHMVTASGIAVFLDRRGQFEPVQFAVGLFAVLWVATVIYALTLMADASTQ